MTKKLTNAKPLMELDIDSFLNSDDNSDDDSLSVPHRTIDDILNASDSSTSTSPPSSPPSIHHHRRPSDLPLPLRKPEPRLLSTNDVSSQVSTESARPSQLDSKTSAYNRVRESIWRTSSFTSTSSTTKQFPSLFGGVRINARPGAALAAAAAASRSVPTPHAAAIKSRRLGSGSLQKVVDDKELSSVAGDEHDVCSSNGDSIGVGTEIISGSGGDFKMGDSQSADNGFSGVDGISESMAESEDNESEEKKFEVKELSVSNADDDSGEACSSICEPAVASASSRDAEDGLKLKENSTNLDPDTISSGDVRNVASVSAGESSVISNEEVSDIRSVSSFPEDDNEGKTREDSAHVELETEKLDIGGPFIESDEGVGISGDGDSDDKSSLSDISELVEERLGQLESERVSKVAQKKSRSSMKPLELAEEIEKKQASTGLHWEEGAAAQPMRLEGVKRGSTALGYFDIDANNVITRNISSQTFRRDHGSPQVLAVHLNYIAVGMSKGVIAVVPSKYSAHIADSMDTKMVLLGLQGDRSHAPVTSMCFNQQGDLLLAGYGDGHITIWDVQRVSAAKVITGEHTAPVVHTFFLGQDSQISRQFKAVTGDSKGYVLLHTSSVVPLLNRFSIKTQCLLDGQTTSTVLSASPLLFDESCGNAPSSSQGNAAVSSNSLGSMMGGVVGGDAGWKLFNESSSLAEEGVVIFVTYQTALVVRLSPLEVYTQLSRPEGVREGSMPYTAWKCVTQSRGSSTGNTSTEASERVSLLAVAWDRKVQVAKLVKSELKVYGNWSVDSAAIGVAWLDEQMLVVATVTGQLYLFAKDGTVIHQTSFSVDGSVGDDLVAYHTHFVNVFGNPEKAYHNCLAVRGASIYILGPLHLVVSRFLTWKERINVLKKAGDWMGALNMAITLYDGQAHGVIGLPRTLDAVQKAVMPFLVELLLAYVDEVFSYISIAFGNQIGRIDQLEEQGSQSSSVHSEIKEQFTRVGGVAVEFCVHIKRTDILFDEIFSKFVAVQQRETFLELLEPYILKDMLGSLPPEIMQCLVEHYSSKGWLQRVEQCVLHMDISSLDFNQVVRLCREHGLYGALFYLFNKGLDDFRAPLEELLAVLQNSQRESAAALGYRMLVYLKYCFSGQAFPPGHGTLSPSRLPSLRTELLQFLLEDSSPCKVQEASSLLSKKAYLNLYHLLELDTEATLEVLKCGIIEYDTSKLEISSSDSADTNLESEKENNLMAETEKTLVQNTIDALIHILDWRTAETDEFASSDDVGSTETWPSKRDISQMFEFIACFVACGRAQISKRVLTQILDYLTSEDNFLHNVSSKKRENKLLSLLKVVPESHWEASYVLHRCEKAHFYQVCGLIHITRRQYLAALDSYIRDADRPIHAFSFINSTLLQLSGNEFDAFRSAVISRIPELVHLSREGAFFLVVSHFNDEGSRILSELHSNRRSLFLYLKTVIEVHLSGSLNFSSLREDETENISGGRSSKDTNEGLEAYLERISDLPRIMRNNPVNVTDDMVELYLELLCQFERDSVLKFLETLESYRVEYCLRLCQEYKIIDAAAFLLERVGDVGTALLLTVSGLNDKFIELNTAVDNVVSRSDFSRSTAVEQFNAVLNLNEVKEISSILHTCIGLCQRNTPRLNPEESETLWFHFLDTFCEPLIGSSGCKMKSEGDSHARMLLESLGLQDDGGADIIKWKIPKSHKGAQLLKKLFSKFIKEIVEGMIGYVRLTAIMSKLLSDNGSQEFGDFKLTILEMLGIYGFERRILDTAKSLIEDDTFYTMSVLKKGASHGYAPRSLLCCICNCLLSKNYSNPRTRVFNCGHATHLQCELLENEASSKNSSGCPVCMPKKNTQRSRNKQTLSENGLVGKFSSKSKPLQRAIIHLHDTDTLDNSYGLQQSSRFEILANLKKDNRLVHIEILPQLKLAPPAVYHEKVKKGTDFSTGESSSAHTKIEKPTKNRRRQEHKAKGSALRFFGKEKTRGG